MKPASSGRLSRLLALAAALAVMSSTAQARQLHQPRHAHARPAGGIFVDVGPLLAKGLGPYAEEVRADLTQALQAQFGGLPPGERLIATIDGISLTSWAGQMENGFLGPSDYINGTIALVGADGRVMAQQRITANSPASSGGAWYIQGNELRRTAALTRVFASWARHYVPS